jgi:hypothetical protein
MGSKQRLVAIGLVTLAVAAVSPAHAQGSKHTPPPPAPPTPAAPAPTPPPPPAPPPKPVRPFKRVVQAVELVTRSKALFDGLVTLVLADAGSREPPLVYYWGGKCSKSSVGTPHIVMLMAAMRDGLAVEIPSYPIRVGEQVVSCVRSIRVLAD